MKVGTGENCPRIFCPGTICPAYQILVTIYVRFSGVFETGFLAVRIELDGDRIDDVERKPETIETRAQVGAGGRHFDANRLHTLPTADRPRTLATVEGTGSISLKSERAVAGSFKPWPV